MNDRSLVLVHWTDAHSMSDYSWMAIEDLSNEPREIMSVGIILPNVCRNHLVLAQSIDPAADTVDHVLAIPLGMVKSIICLDAGIQLPLERVAN